MNSSQFLRVYRVTPSGSRVCLIFSTRFSRAANSSVIDLLAVFVKDEFEHSFHSIIMNDNFREFADSEYLRFVSLVCNDTRDMFAKRCRYSFETFKSVCRNLYVDEKSLMLF